MLISKDFVILNNPKTGSTFVRGVVKDLYKKRKNAVSRFLEYVGFVEPSLKELMLPNIRDLGVRPRDQHGTFSQIPVKHKSKRVISVVRNPYSKLLSLFEYGWWKIYPPIDIIQLKTRFPYFPDLSIDEYIDLREIVDNERKTGVLENIGPQSRQFIQMFSKDPNDFFVSIDSPRIIDGSYKSKMGEILFLKQEELAEQLILFLISCGFDKEELSFIKERKHVNVSKSSSRDELMTDKVVEYVERKEHLLFRMLSDYGINYSI